MQVAEKEEFRNYLEKNGVVDALTKGNQRDVNGEINSYHTCSFSWFI